MIKDNRIYLYYEEYESLYGQTRRPAVVRYSKRAPTYSWYSSDNSSIICTLYIDGKTDTSEIFKNLRIGKNSCSLVIVSPFHSEEDEYETFNLEAIAFNASSVDDWICLFHDTSEFQRMGDKMSFANLAIALGRFRINVPTIIEALNYFQEDVKARLVDLINHVAYGLSIQKIRQITELNNAIGKTSQLFFPVLLENAAKQYGIEYEHLSVHSLADKLFEEYKDQDIKDPSDFVRIIQWLQDDERNITIEELEAGFAYLGEEKRAAAIKRFFYDVKRGVFQYNNTSLKAFSSQNYQYYSSLRYIFEKWPCNRNVSTEFLLDCLNTYQETNQKQFQVTNGILDWAIQKAKMLDRPIDMKFYDWLCYCQGGVVQNKEFQGFAEFYIQYKLDEMMFEGESLSSNIKTIFQHHCDRVFHSVYKLHFDNRTGEYDRYPETEKPKYHVERVWENLWKARSQEDLSFFSQFVDITQCILILTPDMLDDFSYTIAGHSTDDVKHRVLSRYCDQISHEVEIVEIDIVRGQIERDLSTNKPITRTVKIQEDRWMLRNNEDINNISLRWRLVNVDPEEYDCVEKYEYTYFTPELIRKSLTVENLEQFLLDHYETLTPYVSDRDKAELIRMFASPFKMKASMNDSSQLGISPGVDEVVVKQRVCSRLIELFGESLECDYNQSLYEQAQSDSQYKRDGESRDCFEEKIKHYYRDREIYCAPDLSDLPNLLTGRNCAICQGDMCFVTTIIKEPEWKDFSLIHILEILGYSILEETEAGYIPNPVYNQFVNQINKAIRFYKRLACKKCGHILFPAQEHGHTRFKCLLPSCSEYNKEVYLNYCHECKKGLIDSRDTKQCPNGLYICPSCNSCCSNEFFESMASRYRRQGRNIPAFISCNIGKGHKDLNMVFCPQCGTQKSDYVNRLGIHELRCLSCHPIEEDEVPPFVENDSIKSFGGDEEFIDPWA